MSVYVNSLIKYFDSDFNTKCVERVLWISIELDQIVLIRIDQKESPYPEFKSYHETIQILDTPFAIILEDDPYSDLNSPSKEYLEKHQSKRDEKWEIIKNHVDYEPYIYDISNLEVIVGQIKKETGKRSKRIYTILREYWIGGKTKNALLPNYINSGGKGKLKRLGKKKKGRPSKLSIEHAEGVNATQDDMEVFEVAIRTLYKNKKTTLKEVYVEMRGRYYISGYKMVNGIRTPILMPDNMVPTYRQFLYWYNRTYNFKEKLLNKYGERQYYLTDRPIVGNEAEKVVGPGDTFEIDATIADIYLVSEIDRSRIIGRPVIYIVKDVYSRMVVGVYVGLEGPSWLAAMMALENTTMSKRSYCKKLGLEINDEDWPSQHLPKKIKADRGEFESANADKLVDSFGIQVINTPPYRADLKGIVERHFRILNERIKLHWVPGIVHKDYMTRGGRDYRLDAKLTLKAFEYIIALTILEHNRTIIKGFLLDKEMMEANIIPTPLNIWTWGVKHKSGLLKQVTRDEIRLNLMPTAKASMTGEGIFFNKMHYICKEAFHDGQLEKARKKRWKINIQHDPRDVEHIYFDKQKWSLVDADKYFSGYRLEEVQEFQFVHETQIGNLGTEQKQMTIDTNAIIRNKINNETKLTSSSQNKKDSNRQRLASIRENRKNEKELQRVEEKWNDTFDEKKEDFVTKINQLEDCQNKEDTDLDTDFLLNVIIDHKEGENIG